MKTLLITLLIATVMALSADAQTNTQPVVTKKLSRQEWLDKNWQYYSSRNPSIQALNRQIAFLDKQITDIGNRKRFADDRYKAQESNRTGHRYYGDSQSQESKQLLIQWTELNKQRAKIVSQISLVKVGYLESISKQAP